MTAALELPHALSAIAGVALDQLHDLSVRQIDQWTARLHQRIGVPERAPSPAPSAHDAAVNGRANGAHTPVVERAVRPPAIPRQAIPLLIGALVGAAVAVSVIESRRAGKTAPAGTAHDGAGERDHGEGGA